MTKSTACSACADGELCHPVGHCLAIESTQGTVSVALGRLEDGMSILIAERAVEPTRDDDVLLPAIDSLLKACSRAPSQLVGVVVGTGPGGFTGARIGVATAQGIAESLRIPIAGLSSGIGIAQSTCGSAWWSREKRDVIVLLASRANACWATHLTAGIDSRHALVSEGLSQSPADWPDDAVIVGDEHMPPWAVAAASCRRRELRRPVVSAAALLALAAGDDGCWRRDAAQVVPRYAHAPSTTPRPQ